MRHGEREDNMNCGGFDHKVEGVRVIKTKKLSIAFCHEMRFEALNGSIIKKFSSKNPFGTDYISIGGPRNKIPSVIYLNRLHFIIHGSKPSWVFGSGFKSLRLKDSKRCMNQWSRLHKVDMSRMSCLENFKFGTSNNGMRAERSG